MARVTNLPAAAGDPRAILSRTAPAPARTSRYGPEPAQVYDVRLPSGPPRGVTVVVVHGGFWQQEFDRTHAGCQAQALADDGFHVAVAEYRRVGMTGGGWPGTFEDVRTAVAQVRADPGLPEATVLLGHSAGGHLAVWTAGQDESTGLLGAVSLAGCVDLALTARMELGDGAARSLMGGTPDEVPDAYALADPARGTSVVPVALVHGADDAVVPPEVSRSYQRQCAVRGTRVSLTVIPGCGHFALIDPAHPAFATVLDTVRDVGSA